MPADFFNLRFLLPVALSTNLCAAQSSHLNIYRIDFYFNRSLRNTFFSIRNFSTIIVASSFSLQSMPIELRCWNCNGIFIQGQSEFSLAQPCRPLFFLLYWVGKKKRSSFFEN